MDIDRNCVNIIKLAKVTHQFTFVLILSIILIYLNKFFWLTTVCIAISNLLFTKKYLDTLMWFIRRGRSLPMNWPIDTLFIYTQHLRWVYRQIKQTFLDYVNMHLLPVSKIG